MCCAAVRGVCAVCVARAVRVLRDVYVVRDVCVLCVLCVMCVLCVVCMMCDVWVCVRWVLCMLCWLRVCVRAWMCCAYCVCLLCALCVWCVLCMLYMLCVCVCAAGLSQPLRPQRLQTLFPQAAAALFVPNRLQPLPDTYCSHSPTLHVRPTSCTGIPHLSSSLLTFCNLLQHSSCLILPCITPSLMMGDSTSCLSPLSC